MSLNNSLMPTPRWVSKGPRSYQLLGPFALPGLRHDISILLGKHGLEGMGDDFLPRLKVPTLDCLIDRCAEKSRNPDVHLPISPFPARLAEALNALGPFSVRHGIHPLHSCRSEKCPILSWLWSRASRIHSQ